MIFPLGRRPSSWQQSHDTQNADITGKKKKKKEHLEHKGEHIHAPLQFHFLYTCSNFIFLPGVQWRFNSFHIRSYLNRKSKSGWKES